ncbi:MAG: rhodanese-like domain-containing protein [Nitrospinota bacterium]
MLQKLPGEARARVPDPGAEAVFYCAGGLRSLFAGKQLQDMVYKNVFSMKGGYHAWRESRHPVG